mgnify:FL=1
MSEFRVNSITNQDGSAGPQVCGVSTFSGKSGVQIPSGPTEFRRQDGGGRGRGIISGGRNLPAAGHIRAIEMIEIPTTGNATDFGDLADTNTGGAGGSSSTTRGFIIGGYDPDGTAHLTTMQYINLSSQGGANLFGDLKSANTAMAQGSNNTRGLLYGGNDPNYISDIFQFNLQSLGTESEFGSVFENEPIRNATAVTSPTRAIFAGGQIAAGNSNIIAFREIASGGIVFKFGELTYAANGHGGASSSTRGIFVGGQNAPTTVTHMDFITIASEGNAQDFGNLTQARRNITGNSNNIRATFAGGTTASSGTANNVNIIDFVTISTTGDATDFGDLSAAKRLSNMGGSDSHGGLAQ